MKLDQQQLPQSSALRDFSPEEKRWLCEALKRLADAGAPELSDRIIKTLPHKAVQDSTQNPAQLLDLLAEVRAGMNLVAHGFHLQYEAKGSGPKSVDFVASTSGLRMWVEVKRLNPDQEERHWLETAMRRDGPDVFAHFCKDDARIGRLVRDAAKKMPDDSDPKALVIHVQSLDEFSEDALDCLYGKYTTKCAHGVAGDLVKAWEGRCGDGKWAEANACTLAAVVLAAPQPGWPYCGPTREIMFVNPARESEAHRAAEHWPIKMV